MHRRRRLNKGRPPGSPLWKNDDPGVPIHHEPVPEKMGRRGDAVSAIEQLLKSEGRWQATYQLRDPENRLADDSVSDATVVGMLGGRFVRVDYRWSYKGEAQEGTMLIGANRATGAVTLAWADTWHNSDTLMICAGAVRDDGTVDVLGSYAAPPGPDWGWRTQIRAEPDRFHLVMYNIAPDGLETVAVDADYRRVS
jgi:hypothetical protein